jgi:ABC-type transport system involved in cytochrome bd biosynthesis fused ATPase/permease subunit
LAIIQSASLRRRRESISLVVMAIFIIAMIAFYIATGRIGHGNLMSWMLALLVYFAVTFAQTAYSSLNSRCPACDGRLGDVIRWARFCPRCRAQLMPDEKIVIHAA